MDAVALQRAVERLQKAVGLAHVDHAPRAPFWPALHRIGDQAERTVHRALVASWRALGPALRDWNLAHVRSVQQVGALEHRLADFIRGRLLDGLTPALLTARQRAGVLLTGRPVPVGKVLGEPATTTLLGGVDWFSLNPRMAAAARTQATGLAQSETAATLEAIREAVVTGLEEGLPVDEASALLEESIGLNARQVRAMGRYAETLQARGVTGGAFTDALERYADEARDYRAELIARTEGQAAANGGAFDTYADAREAGLLPVELVKEWIAAPDACPICAELDGVQVAFDEEWEPEDADPILYPPAHPQCRCKFGMAEPSAEAEGRA